MAISVEHKLQIVKKFGASVTDTGSPEVQIALLTANISSLQVHIQTNQQDHHSRRGLIRMVNQRRKLLAYLKRKNFHSYQSLIQRLGLK